MAQAPLDGPVNVKSDAAEHPAQRITTPAIPANPKRTDDAAERAADGKALGRRAGEQSRDDPNARSIVLGMELQENPSGRPVVVGVGVATPAYDAGIRKGDEIVSYQDFTAHTYRRWVDGIRRLTSDAPGNSPVLVVVNRDGNRVPITIRVPVTPARPLATRVPGTRATPPPQPSQTVVNQQVAAAPTGVPAGGGGDVLIDNQLGNFFGNDAASANERAIAHIVRIHDRRLTDSPAPPSESTGASTAPLGVGQNSSAGPGTANPTGAPARIGLAGFRDDPTGMVVMIDVGSLQPGNYSVAIGDPSVMNGGSESSPSAAQNPTIQTPAGQNPSGATTPANPSDPARRNLDSPTGAAPAGAPTKEAPTNAPLKRAGQPQSSAIPSSLIPRTVLAQVNTSEQTTNTGTAAPATGASAGSTSGQANPAKVPSTGQPGASSTTTTGGQQNTASTTATGAGVGASGGTLGDIGTLTVDQSGTGRMQKTVETMRVRNVVGQAVILYSGNSGQPTLPANLNGSAGAASKQGVVDAPNAAQGNAASKSAGTTGSTTTAAQQGLPNSRVAVAAGIIQLVPDHPSTNGAAGTGTASSTSTETTTPSTATPKTGQELVR